ncbi:MAG: nucleotidyltransferase family protein, partial [Lachnospiraceae bacterium]|nr:nucleotidyltransferase family protein [Lachnospiraceae bacterium]
NREIIRCLRSISKYNILNEDYENIIKFLKLNDQKLDSILGKNKLQILLLKHIEHIGCGNLISRIRYKSYSNWLFHLQYQYSEYLDIIYELSQSFAEKNIRYAILKGMANNAELFVENSILYRPFADLDILIDVAQIDKVGDILKEHSFVQGYFKNNQIVKATRKELIYWRLNSHQLHEYVKFSKYSNISSLYRLAIDVNFTIFEGGKCNDPINNSNILDHVMDRFIAPNSIIKCLDYTYGLLQLCYHFYKDTVYEVKKNTHDNYCLKKFCDIREYVIKFYNHINWNEFIVTVNGAKIGNQIYHTLLLVSTFYGDLNIDEILQQINVTERLCTENIDWEAMLL